MSRKLILLSIIFSYSFLSSAQSRFTIKGKVSHNGTNLPIPGAVVLVTDNGIGTVADSSGNYQMRVPKGTFLFEISHTSFFKKYSKIEIKKDETINFNLDQKTESLDELMVTANGADQNLKRVGTGVNTINAKSLKKLPTLLGEVDVIKSLYTLPGVTSVGEGATGFNVRGGNIDQNLILQDEAPLFNSSHLLGFFSVFNPDAFRDYSFYRGGMPAQYGGRVASVLAVNLKDANAPQLSVNGGIGTISSRLMVETPLIKDKVGFYVAGRISYVDQMVRALRIKKLDGSRAAFYDLTSKLEIKPSKKDKIAITFFQGNDQFRLAKDTVSAIDENGNALYDWTSRNISGTWSHFFSKKFTTKLIAASSFYDANINNSDSLTSFNLNYQLNYKSLKAIGSYLLGDKNELDFGAQYIRYDIKPGELIPLSVFSNKNKDVLNPEQATENSVFVFDKINVNSKFNFSLGLRYTIFNNLGSSTVYNYAENQPLNPLTRTDSTNFDKGSKVQSYSSLEPRISANYNINNSSSIKLSINRAKQFIHLLSGTTAALPTDRWKLSDRYIKPQMADQVSLGFYKNIKEKSSEASFEVFYKKLYDVIDYKDGETLLQNKLIETAILQGEGLSYGAELYYKKSLGVLTGWFSYTYSNTLLRVKGSTPEETINNGAYFPPVWNRPHSFNAIGSYQVSKKVNFSSNLNFSSGRSITYPLSKFYYSGATLPYYNNRNQDRIPSYVRLDLSMNIETHPYRTTGYKGNWNFSLYNVLGRRNAYSVFFRARNPYNPFYSKVKIYKLSVLGTIIPSVSYNFKF
jgi:ferric enterobactin receptor